MIRGNGRSHGGLVLGLLGLLGLGAVSGAEWLTRDRIAAHRRAVVLREMAALLPAEAFDNDLLTDVVYGRDPRLGSGQPVAIHRARRQGVPVAAILAPVAPEGYGGPLRLLVGIGADGVVTGVRVLEHRETPGLGDLVEPERSDWMLGFVGRSLTNPTAAGWRVKRDGGAFDQFAGATVTPRAVVRAVHGSLRWFVDHRDRVFSTPTGLTVEER